MPDGATETVTGGRTLPEKTGPERAGPELAGAPPEPSALKKEVLSIGRNSSIYFIGQALSRAVGFLMLPVYTRFLTPADYGIMEMIEILVSAIAIIIAVNVGDTMPRFYYAEKDESGRRKVVSSTILGLSLLAVPVVLIFLAFSGLLSLLIADDLQNQQSVRIAIITLLFSMLCEIGYSYLRMRYLAATFVVITVAQLALALSLNIYFIAYLKMGLLGAYYSNLLSQSLTGIFLSAWILKQVGLHLSRSLVGRLLGFGLPLVPSRIGLMLGFVSNRFFLRWHGPQAASPEFALAQIGLLSLAHRFGVIVNRFINVPFNSHWGPRRLELLLKGEPGARETVAQICTYATLGSIFFALVLSSGVENVIEIIADRKFLGAHALVPLVALSYVALGLETHFSTGILYSGKTSYTAWIGLLSLVVVLAWNFALVPVWGLWGAATSNVAGFMVRCALMYWVSQSLVQIPFELRRLATLFIAAAALYLASRWVDLGWPWWTLLARMGLAALLPLLLWPLGFYRPGELELIRRTLRRRRWPPKL